MKPRLVNGDRLTIVDKLKVARQLELECLHRLAQFMRRRLPVWRLRLLALPRLAPGTLPYCYSSGMAPMDLLGASRLVGQNRHAATGRLHIDELHSLERAAIMK